ncbi:MAG: hypothetical protein M9932_03420 [Xanthobacteraceae bacterium]|nr:hypothetical protein [Xanthobacteraceae bacterium]
MDFAAPPNFQVHWSIVPIEEAGGLASPGCRLLAIWPAPVNRDACFAEAGFTLFGDNDEAWDRAAEEVLARVIAALSRFGAARLLSKPLREKPPWYLRAFRAGRELSLQQQASWPMQWDSLPPFHARFGNGGAALRTGNGHFLLWVNLPESEPAPSEFVGTVAESWNVVETRLRWNALLPDV